MSNTLLSIIKIGTAISFFCILVVSEKLALPMVFILLMGIGSGVKGDPSGFILSLASLLSAGYLIFSALIDIRKINFMLSALSTAMLISFAVYAILQDNVVFPTHSVVTYVIFFFFAFVYFPGCAIRWKGFYK
jgi:hypothetical protein